MASAAVATATAILIPESIDAKQITFPVLSPLEIKQGSRWQMYICDVDAECEFDEFGCSFTTVPNYIVSNNRLYKRYDKYEFELLEPVTDYKTTPYLSKMRPLAKINPLWLLVTDNRYCLIPDLQSRRFSSSTSQHLWRVQNHGIVATWHNPDA